MFKCPKCKIEFDLDDSAMEYHEDPIKDYLELTINCLLLIHRCRCIIPIKSVGVVYD